MRAALWERGADADCIEFWIKASNTRPTQSSQCPTGSASVFCLSSCVVCAFVFFLWTTVCFFSCLVPQLKLLMDPPCLKLFSLPQKKHVAKDVMGRERTLEWIILQENLCARSKLFGLQSGETVDVLSCRNESFSPPAMHYKKFVQPQDISLKKWKQKIWTQDKYLKGTQANKW